MVRVRFAPSPTGNLHIGTCRTALFNWIFAKKNKGRCILRIEDTDLERSDRGFETNIDSGLEWLGLLADESPQKPGEYGPYRQSERIEQGVYQTYIDQLLDQGVAYYCFETPEELDKERQAAIDRGEAYVYSRKSLTLSDEQIKQKLIEKVPYTVRFKISKSSVIFHDIIRGEIEFDTSLLSDFILLKSDGSPSYNFAVVVDDIEMNISHVIRGEDHISNTPRQILLFEAIGGKIPKFAHMPMILGPDKSKLSKRHGATAITDYQGSGFVKEAFINYLCLLGWTPPNQQEILDIESIIEQFELSSMNKAGAVFDIQKLTWMNGQYIRKLSPEALFNEVNVYFSNDIRQGLNQWSIGDQYKIVATVQDNLDRLTDINQYLSVYIETDQEFRNKWNDQTLTLEQIEVLKQLNSQFKTQNPEDLDPESFTRLISATHDSIGGPKGKIFKTFRLGVTGEGSGPNLRDCLQLLGVERCVNRIEMALDIHVS